MKWLEFFFFKNLKLNVSYPIFDINPSIILSQTNWGYKKPWKTLILTLFDWNSISSLMLLLLWLKVDWRFDWTPTNPVFWLAKTPRKSFKPLFVFVYMWVFVNDRKFRHISIAFQSIYFTDFVKSRLTSQLIPFNLEFVFETSIRN